MNIIHFNWLPENVNPFSIYFVSALYSNLLPSQNKLGYTKLQYIYANDTYALCNIPQGKT